jgi:acetyltransferase-like isoleucine patch superfamily enzyme
MNSDFFPQNELKNMGFKFLGKNLKISKNVTIIGKKNISIGDNSRIDDYTIISALEGFLDIGSNVHIGGQSYLGCAAGITLHNNINISQGVRIYSKINDYLNFDKSNADKVILSPIEIENNVIVGSGSVIIGKSKLSEGCVVGALSFVKENLDPWTVYAGNPLKFIKKRNKINFNET